MPQNQTGSRVIYFEWNQNGFQGRFAVYAADLAGVATQCPFGWFPGLPEHVLGLVLWNGQLFPVLDLSPLLGGEYVTQFRKALEEGHAVFAFGTHLLPVPFAQVALAIPSFLRSLREDHIEASVKIWRLAELVKQLIAANDKAHEQKTAA